MDYYKLMSKDIIEQQLLYKHIDFVMNQSRLLSKGKINHVTFDLVRNEMMNYFKDLFEEDEYIKIIFSVGYINPYKRLRLTKYFSKYEHFKFNIFNNELSETCHQYEFVIHKRDLKADKLFKDISYQDFAYESQTYRKASIYTVITNIAEDKFYYPYDDRGAVIFKK
ncbi:hypothetical protein ACMGE5_06590 [Macrococcus equi]|uniref:DUF3885 domain-containing protein n=1 Tax=Macrococcus equi TaxID=3395462 RepID=UPI0039BE1C7C